MFWDDWTYEMFFHDAIVVLVCTFVLSSFVTSAGHLATAWVTGRQESQTPLGPAMTRRELALGIKAGLRMAFDVLLVLAVVWDVRFGTNPFVLVVTVPLTFAAWAVVWYMIYFLRVLRRELQTHPVAVTRFSEETSNTIDETASDVRDVRSRVRNIEDKIGAGRD